MKQRYYSYKPSGIDWIGDIPSHWDITPLKRNLRMPLKYGANEPAESEDKNYPRYIRITDIDSNGNLKDETFKSLEPSKATDYLLVKGDVLFARSGATVGKTYIFKEPYEACFAGYLIKASCSLRLSPQFLFYYTNSGMYNNWKNSIFIQSTIQNIGADKYSLLPLPLPPLAEQEAIAAWLDEKCGEIDAAIAKVDREIELIDELKQSEISRVVTRGLNPDTPLRPSGIDWIGDVPEHWEICRIKHKADVVLGKMLLNEPPKEQRNIYSKEKYLKSRNIGWLNLLLDEVDEMWFNESEKSLYKLNDGDVLVNEGGDIGKVAIWHNQEDSFYIQNSVHKISPIGVTSGFLVYWIFSLSKRDYFWSIVSQVSIAHLTKEKLSNTPLIVPPLAEQQAIADYLDKKCAEIDGLKAKLSRKHKTLTELRQSIISEVVTGKRRVAACRDRIIRDIDIDNRDIDIDRGIDIDNGGRDIDRGIDIDNGGRDRSRPYKHHHNNNSHKH